MCVWIFFKAYPKSFIKTSENCVNILGEKNISLLIFIFIIVSHPRTVVKGLSYVKNNSENSIVSHEEIQVLQQ